MSVDEATLGDSLPDARGPLTTTRKARPVRPRGLFDFLLVVMLLYGVYAKTPIGALAEWVIRAGVLKQEHTPSLFATFRGRESDAGLDQAHLQKGVLASLHFPPSIEEASARTRVDPELLAVLAASQGRCDGPDCYVTAPPHLESLLERPVAADEVPIDLVAIALAKGAIRFEASPLLATEALFVPPHALERAIGQARASGLQSPEDLEVHADFLPPTLRRGQLQDAIAVLALHRLRTLSWPVDPEKRVTSPFGYRVHPITKKRRFHNGADVGVANGTPLKSAHRGVVRRVGQDSISGNYVHLDHGFGIVSTHCHMTEAHVEAGQRVRRGQVVGLSGETGRVTGPHLHYILRIDGKAVDPEAYGEAPGRHRATPASGSGSDDDEGAPDEGASPATVRSKDAGPR